MILCIIALNFQTLKAQFKKNIFEGQVINKETNEPIPFASIISKKSGIYRIADANGLFKLLIKDTTDNISIEISSIGFNPYKTSFKNLTKKIFLSPNLEELNEIIISGFLSPKTVLEKAINNKKNNHPIKPFNFYRYGNILINNDDKTEIDLELVTKDCDYGYLSEYVISQRVEQIKWNYRTNKKLYKNSAQFFSYRQNAIRYASILNKKKLKKFKLEFFKPDKQKNNNLYIISFKTEKNNWKYTNKGYPTVYSGFIYINKENFAIEKVVENWTSNLKKENAKKYFKNLNFENISEITIKEENICDFSNILKDNKYYATRYFNRLITEVTNIKNVKNIRTYEADSYLFDFKTTDVEEIEYYEDNNKKENSLHRVEYDKGFWKSFYNRKIKNLYKQ